MIGICVCPQPPFLAMSRLSPLLVAVLAFAWLACSSVSAAGDYSRIRSLARYFRLVLDFNGDGGISQKEYQTHLEEMDPQATPRLPLAYTNLRHNELDLDGDEMITSEELCVAVEVCDPSEVEPSTYDWILSSNLTEPIQIHLAATTVPDHMTINWSQNVSNPADPTGEVQWGTVSGKYTQSAQATWQNYTVSRSGLSYTSLPLFNATISGLLPNTAIYYIVGNSVDGFSPEFMFTTLPDPTVPAEKQITTRMVVYGDQGTVIPMGQTVCKWVEAENAQNPFGMLLHVGDLSYAGVSHSMGEYEPTWSVGSAKHRTVSLSDFSPFSVCVCCPPRLRDAWMQQISPIASVMPYMTSVGNHEVRLSTAESHKMDGLRPLVLMRPCFFLLGLF